MWTQDVLHIVERGEGPPRLTVRERILLHLVEQRAEGIGYHLPEEVTQTGLSAAVGIAQKHVPQYVRSMIDERLLAERTGRVEGSRQRRKAYSLTDDGRKVATRLRGELLGRPVDVELDDGVRRMALREAVRDHFRGTPLLVLLDTMDAKGHLRPREAPAPAAEVSAGPPLESPVVRSFLEKAAELEGAYEWPGAADLYRRLLAQIPDRTTFARADIEERTGYAVTRAAFQAEAPQEFARRMVEARDAYGRAGQDYARGESPMIMAKRLRCDAWVAYASYWLAADTSEKRRLIQDAWTLTKASLDAFAAASAETEFRETYVRLCLSASLVHHYAPDVLAREAVIREGLAYGEKAIGSLTQTTDTMRLAAAYVQALGFSEALGADYLPEGSGREENLEKGSRYWKRALELSETGALTTLPVAAVAATYALWGPGTREAIATFERALEKAMETKDRFLIGSAHDMLAFHLCWLSGASDESKDAVEVLGKALKHAEAARDAFTKISFIPSSNGALWSWEPYPDYYLYLGSRQPSPEEKRRLLRHALDGISTLSEKARRSGYPYILSYWHALVGAILSDLAKMERGPEEKRKILEEAIEHTRLGRAIDLQILPPMHWDIGIGGTNLANLQFELALLSKDAETKQSVLEAAISQKEESLAILRRAVTASPSMESHSLGRSQAELGEMFRRLGEASGGLALPARAATAFLDAADSFVRAELPSRAAECHWNAAKTFDGVGDYLKAADHFDAASKGYDTASQRMPQSKGFYEDHARYMRAWSEIEKARYHHARQEYAKAREFYDRTAALLSLTDRWKSFAPNYYAWAKLEDAEDLSRREAGSEAIRAFEEAIRFFVQTKESLMRETASPEGGERQRLAAELIRAADTRREYCRARMLLEEARLLEKAGDHSSASEKHGLAAAILQGLAGAMEHEDHRRELRLIMTLAQAWQKMAAAEAEASPELFREASRLFTEAKDLAGSEASRMLASGHSRLCLALGAGARFTDTRDVTFHGEAVRQLESAAVYYEKAGFPRASGYAKASKLLFDAYVYLDRANEERDPGTRTRMYGMVERVLQAAADAYAKADLPAKEEEVARLLGRVKDERQLAASLTEVLRAPAIASATAAFETPTPSYETPAGLDRFERADIQGSLVAPRKSVSIAETVLVELGLVNTGRGPAQLVRVEALPPEGFDLVAAEGHCTVGEGYLDLNGRRLEPLKTEVVKVILRPRQPGVYTLAPKVLYMDEDGEYRTHEPIPVEVSVRA